MSAEAPVLERCDTGTAGLDHISGGGFPAQALYLLQGNPGVGKTTLVMQFLLAGSRKSESCLYVTFSQTRQKLFTVARLHGWSLDGLNILELSSLAQQLTAEAANTLFDPDTVIILRHFEARASVRQSILVTKKRSGENERTIRDFKGTERGLWVGEPLLHFRGVVTGVPVLESRPGSTKDKESGDPGN
jgi:KaiC/GvpD/RAD55 family RecA-like ATPase